MIGGVLGGFAGALAFGAITGATTVSRWFLIFMLGGILGAVFTTLPWVKRWAPHSFHVTVGLGVAWGAVLWVPSLLIYPWHSLLGFAVWGLFVGGLYDITNRVAAASERSPV